MLADIRSDYCIVAFMIVLIVSTIQWLTDGRNNYKGPRVEIGGEVLEDSEAPNMVAGQPSSHQGNGEVGSRSNGAAGSKKD